MHSTTAVACRALAGRDRQGAATLLQACVSALAASANGQTNQAYEALTFDVP